MKQKNDLIAWRKASVQELRLAADLLNTVDRICGRALDAENPLASDKCGVLMRRAIRDMDKAMAEIEESLRISPRMAMVREWEDIVKILCPLWPGPPEGVALAEVVDADSPKWPPPDAPAKAAELVRSRVGELVASHNREIRSPEVFNFYGLDDDDCQYLARLRPLVLQKTKEGWRLASFRDDALAETESELSDSRDAMSGALRHMDDLMDIISASAFLPTCLKDLEEMLDLLVENPLVARLRRETTTLHSMVGVFKGMAAGMDLAFGKIEDQLLAMREPLDTLRNELEVEVEAKEDVPLVSKEDLARSETWMG